MIKNKLQKFIWIYYFIVLNLCLIQGFEAYPLSLTQRFLSSECVIDDTTLAEVQKFKFLNPFLCLNLKLNLQTLSFDIGPYKTTTLYYAGLYSGVYLNPYFSFHANFLYKKFNYYNYKIFSKNWRWDSFGSEEFKITEYAFWQIGNPALTRLHMLVGKLYCPFGLNLKFDNELIDSLLKNDSYWKFPKYGAQVIIDNLKDTRYELIYGIDDLNLKTLHNNNNDHNSQLIGVRFSYDMPALEGLRLIVSVLNNFNDYMRYSIAFLNVNNIGAQTAIEYVREQFEDIFKGEYHQLVKIAHVSSADKYQGKIMFEYEHDKDNYHLILLGYDKKILKYGQIKLAPLYEYKLYPKRENIWGVFLSLGLIL